MACKDFGRTSAVLPIGANLETIFVYILPRPRFPKVILLLVGEARTLFICNRQQWSGGGTRRVIGCLVKRSVSRLQQVLDCLRVGCDIWRPLIDSAACGSQLDLPLRCPESLSFQ